MSARAHLLNLAVLRNEALEETSYTTTATEESRMYEGINDRKRSCPAVSQSCNLTVLSSRYIVFERKSIPIVACRQCSHTRESEK